MFAGQVGVVPVIAPLNEYVIPWYFHNSIKCSLVSGQLVMMALKSCL